MSTSSARVIRVLAVIAIVLGVALAIYPAFLVVRSGPTPEGLIQVLVCAAIVAVSVIVLRATRPKNAVKS